MADNDPVVDRPMIVKSNGVVLVVVVVVVDVEMSLLCSSTCRSRFLTFVVRLEMDVFRTLIAIELVVDLASILWMWNK